MTLLASCFSDHLRHFTHLGVWRRRELLVRLLVWSCFGALFRMVHVCSSWIGEIVCRRLSMAMVLCEFVALCRASRWFSRLRLTVFALEADFALVSSVLTLWQSLHYSFAFRFRCPALMWKEDRMRWLMLTSNSVYCAWFQTSTPSGMQVPSEFLCNRLNFKVCTHNKNSL